MGRVNEFFICNGCSESLIHLYEWDLLDINVEQDNVIYKCPLCGTVNNSKDLK